MANKMHTVTNGEWCVGTTSGSGIEGHKLSVFREYPGRRGGKFMYGDANGRLFATSDEANKFCLERGYLKYYAVPYCPVCRKEHINQYSDYQEPKRESWCPVAEASTFYLKVKEMVLPE